MYIDLTLGSYYPQYGYIAMPVQHWVIFCYYILIILLTGHNLSIMSFFLLQKNTAVFVQSREISCPRESTCLHKRKEKLFSCESMSMSKRVQEKKVYWNMLIQKIWTGNKTEFMEPATEKTKYSKDVALRILPENTNHVNPAKELTQLFFSFCWGCLFVKY